MSKKTFYELVNDLHPPKYKVWITAKTKQEAARALGFSKNPEAAEPLALALADKDVADAAVTALVHIPIPEAVKKNALKALLAYTRQREQDFITAFFDNDKNPEVMALSPEQKGHPILKEPESYLAGAVAMVRNLDQEKAAGVDAATGEGLDIYSRQKFRRNVRLLNKHGVFLTWPQIEQIDKFIQAAQSVMDRIMGKESQSEKTGVSAAAARSQTDAPAPDDAAVEQFAQKGLERRADISVIIADVPRLVFAAASALHARYPHVPSPDASRMAADAISLECPHCGPIEKALQKKFLYAVAGQFAQGAPLAKIALDRSNAGVLATGRCPGCDDKTVKAVLDRNWIAIPDKPDAAAPPAQKQEEAAQEKGEGLFNVVLSGSLMPGFDREIVQSNLAALFKMDANKAAALLDNKPRIIKKNADRQTAAKFEQAIKKAGAEAKIEPV
ncbi:MAG: hypothetical protein QMD09_12285 [Desulfatibacillaceae bacterium]|nr:hypothetical protein [Desulfatibacillaceae bacterium]